MSNFWKRGFPHFRVEKKTAESLLIASILILSPLNVFWKFSENSGYINGILSDYRIFKIWIGEIPSVLLLLFLLKEGWKNRSFLWKKFSQSPVLWWMGAGTLLLLGRQFFVATPLHSFWYAFQSVQVLGFFLFVRSRWKSLNHSLLYGALLISVVFQIGVAQWQFFTQKNLLPYRFLGETQLQGSLNISKSVLGEKLTILPYGTTAHPNILAGFLVAAGILLLQFLSRHNFPGKTVLWLGLVAGISWTLFLTQSLSAWLAWFLFCFFQTFPFIKKYISSWFVLGLLVVFPVVLQHLSLWFSSLSLQRRVFLNTHGFLLFLQNPLWGTGLNQSLQAMGNIYSGETARFLQPVHHAVILWGVETGVVGLTVLWKAASHWFKKWSWFALVILPLISLDHYLLTQWLGGITLCLLLLTPQIMEEE